MHTAYNELSDSDKEDFKSETSVLLRILNKNAVNDINDVVRSTNNQNPMKARNLVSNSTEQIGYSRLFAKQLNWFYEAKEGAWNAFEKDPKRWRPSLNKRTKDFKVVNKVKKIDNLVLAQTWLSFFGCSSIASEEKQHLFSNHYDLIFKKRVKVHGYHFDFSAKNAGSSENSEDSSPEAGLMFISYLSTLFAKNIIPSKSKFRAHCIDRLGSSINKTLEVSDYTKLSNQELDGKLFEKDNEFAMQSILSYMPLLFTEFVGFVLFESLKGSIYMSSTSVLSTPSFRTIKDDLNFESVNTKIESGEYDDNDLLIILWSIFNYIVDGWVYTASWKESYRGADRKQRFILSKETRNKLYKEVLELDSFLTKKQMAKTWALGFDEGEGIFDFVRKTVTGGHK